MQPEIRVHPSHEARLGDMPLTHAVDEFLRMSRGVKMGISVPQVVEELIAAKTQD